MTDGQEFNPAKNVELKPKKDVIHCQESKQENDADLTPNAVVTNEKELKLAQDKELKQEKSFINDWQPKPAENVELVNHEEFTRGKAVEELKLASDIEERKSKLHALELKKSQLKPKMVMNYARKMNQTGAVAEKKKSEAPAHILRQEKKISKLCMRETKEATLERDGNGSSEASKDKKKKPWQLQRKYL